MMTYFHNSLEIHWFAMTSVREKAVSRPMLLSQPNEKGWFVARNIFDNEALDYLAKFSRS